LETEQKEIRTVEGEMPPQNAPQPQAPQSVGVLLKTERERLGLSLEHITEKTRMRPQVLEAIEHEAWDSLPPPVFVRGFLRSYAKVLGISQELVLGLYAKHMPSESPGLATHLEPSRNRRPRAWVVLLSVAILAAVYGMWHFYPSLQVNPGSRITENKDHKGTSAISQPAVVSPSAVATPPEVVNPPAVAIPSAVTSPPAVESSSPLRPVEAPLKQEPAPVQRVGRDIPSSPQGGKPLVKADDADGWLSLTGIVKERTWLRITIDGKEEKEYLFQPGSRPQWKGKESFYMIIGNAGGIDFELNGKKVGDLGKSGRVVRLTLPRNVGRQERAN
jgi:cytoskeleton protein RodZ